MNESGMSLSSSSSSGKDKIFGSKCFTVAGSYLIFLIYSSKISLLVVLELLRVIEALFFGVAIGVGGGIEEESSTLLILLMVVLHGATTGEEDTGVSTGVILFNLIFSFLFKFWRVLDKDATNWLSLSRL